MTRSSTILLSAFALAFTVAGASAARNDGGTAHAAAAPASAKTVIQVYKSPTCGCCKNWVDHIRANGFQAEVFDISEEELQGRKAKLGVGPRLASCQRAGKPPEPRPGATGVAQHRGSVGAPQDGHAPEQVAFQDLSFVLSFPRFTAHGPLLTAMSRAPPTFPWNAGCRARPPAATVRAPWPRRGRP